MITINSIADLQAATTAELLEFFNHNSDSQVKRFADRKTAERRVLKLIEENRGPLPETADKKPGKKPAPTSSRTAAEGITDSWTDPAVRAARSARIHISVDGEEFGSVRKAFIELGLPLNKHIPFRGQLREAGKLEAFGHKWEVTEIKEAK